MKSVVNVSCLTLAALGASVFAHMADADAIPVTAENFAQAETAWNFNNWARLGADKAMFHYRDPAPAGPDAPTVRMNWDTLYSARIINVADDRAFTVTMPDAAPYISAQVMDENGFSPYYLVEKGVPHDLTVDTDYVMVLFRTQITDRNSDAAMADLHAIQDRIEISGIIENSPYTPADYDQNQLEALRIAYKEEFLNAGIDYTYAKGPGEQDQHILDLSHAAGWGGYPPELGISNAYSSSPALAGDTCMAVSFTDPENAFFTSFILYDQDGYIIDGNSYITSDTWTPNADGTITLHFNCDDDAINNLSSGGAPFNYSIRNYGVSQMVLDGQFRPLNPKPVTR